MEPKRVSGCIFEDTPRECSQVINNKCIGGVSKLNCVFSHYHLVIMEDAKTELMDLFTKEMNSPRRHKHLSGLAGRTQ